MLKNKRGFTLMELLIVIAVLGVLVLLAAPKLLDYTEEAELVRIQHDVKVMEQEMATILLGQELNSFKNNNKQLSSLIVQKKLFESEGVAEKIDVKHLSKNGVFNGNLASLDRSNLGVGGNLISVDSKLGSGGELYTVASKGLFTDASSSFSIDKTYKIIPENYNDKIGTNLDGTFYANSLGKVYYEHDKSLADDSAEKGLNCPVASELGYVFEIVNGKGTITGWNGTGFHLVIPPAFLMEVDGKDECVPVKVIGKGAFMNGDFRKVVLPNSLEIIEEDAFKGNDLTNIEIPKGVTQIGNGAFQDNNIGEVTIPHGVTNIGDNAFGGNNFGSGGGSGGGLIIIYNKPGNVTIGDNAFGGGTPVYKTPTAQDAGIIFYPTVDSDGNKTGSIISRPPEFESKYNSVVIPEYIEVNGEEHKVTEVHSGAYQGAGIISVKFPEGLERIEDYAFAGNQIINVILPNSIVHVGNYAFAFNELVGEKGPFDVKGTIKVAKVNQKDYFSQIDVNGNIIINGVKAETISGATMLDHIFVTSDNPHVILERPVAVISAGDVNQITSGRKVNWSHENSVASNGGTIVSAEWKNKQDIYSSKGDYEISLRVQDNSGTWSNWTTQRFTISNSAPATPVITRSPGGNVKPGTPVKITAKSTDPDGDALTYVWEGRDKETQVYPKGRNIVTVHAVDSSGAESAKAAIVFVVADASGGGMLLTSKESTITEEGIPGATIANFTFTVPEVSGHSGADYGQVRGWNEKTNAWELIERRNVSNGIVMTGTLPTGKYSKLEMFYLATHCMYNKSNITYEVDFHFE